MMKLNFQKDNRLIAQAGILIALFCTIGPFSVRLSPAVPMTLQPFMLAIITLLLPFKAATAAIVIYLLLGAIGFPVYSGYVGGAGHLFGPTGGFLFGFALFPIAYNLFTKAGIIKNGFWNALVGLALSQATIYVAGVFGLGLLHQYKWIAAKGFIAKSLLPFYALNIAQSILAVVIYQKIVKAGFKISK